MRLGLVVQVDANHLKPKAQSIWVIANGHDPAFDNTITAPFVRNWRKQGTEDLPTYLVVDLSSRFRHAEPIDRAKKTC